MIKFHKINGTPSNVSAGQENVWFSSPQGIYVADNKGTPRLISPGLQVGTTIPTGTPPSAGLFYYNSNNGKNYISTATKWNEITVNQIPGSTSGSGNDAGNILLQDSGNNYTAIDAEGAFAEIAEKFPWYFNNKKLRNYTSDVNSLKESSEYYVANEATNKPGDKTGWLIQRQATNNKSYGLEIADDNRLVTRVDNRYEVLPNAADLSALESRLNTSISNTVSNAGKYAVKAGSGISVSGANISSGQTISLSTDILNKINNAGTGTDYVKKSGDTMTGVLRLSGRNAGLQLAGTSSPNNFYLLDESEGTGIAHPYSPAWGKIFGPRIRFFDGRNNRDVLSFYPEGSLDLQVNGPRFILMQESTQGVFLLENKSQTNSLHLKAAPGHGRVLFIEGPMGSMHIGTGMRGTRDTGYNYLNSYSGLGNGRRSFFLGTRDYNPIPEFWAKADRIRLDGSIYTTASIYLGYDLNTGKSTMGDNCIRFFSPKVGGDGSALSREVHGLLYWDYKGRQMMFDSYQTGKGGSKPIYVNATGFRSRSSKIYKNVIGKFEGNALDGVMSADAYLYNFKNDSKKETKLGLIIEENAPEEIVSPDKKSIDSYSMAAYLWKALQELTVESRDKIAKLEQKIEELNNKY